MAGVKTFDLLVGVVLVLQCARNVHAEITSRNGKKKPTPAPTEMRLQRAAGSHGGPAVSHRWNQA